MSVDVQRAQWFLLRGLARESGHWGSFIDDMERMFPSALIETIDLPGTGAYIHKPAPVSIPKMASFAREEFKSKRDRSRPAFLFAVSLGAMVAVEWLNQSSEDVSGAVLVNTSFRGCSPFYRRLWLESYPHLVRAMRERDVERRERHVLAMISNRPELHERVAREWAKLYTERPITRETFTRQLFAASRYSPPATTPDVPLLILNSLSDRMVHPSCSEAIAARWRCELRRHPTAGHDLTLDAGPWVTQALDGWLKDNFAMRSTKSADASPVSR